MQTLFLLSINPMPWQNPQTLQLQKQRWSICTAISWKIGGLPAQEYYDPVFLVLVNKKGTIVRGLNEANIYQKLRRNARHSFFASLIHQLPTLPFFPHYRQACDCKYPLHSIPLEELRLLQPLLYYHKESKHTLSLGRLI